MDNFLSIIYAVRQFMVKGGNDGCAGNAVCVVQCTVFGLYRNRRCNRLSIRHF